MIPTEFKPRTFADLIGPAHKVGVILDAKIRRIKAAKPTASKLLFYGEPGTGKSSLARLATEALAGHDYSIERVSGVKTNVELVNGWLRTLGTASLFGDWQIKLIEEMDRVTPAAQDLLLDYLDKLPHGCAVIGTSNSQLEGLQARFQTRFQTWQVDAPSTEEIAEFLRSKWPELSTQHASMIAVGSGGNVRAALLDAESQLDVQWALAA